VGQGSATTYRLSQWWALQSSTVRAATWVLGVLAFVGLLLAVLAFTRSTTTASSSPTTSVKAPAEMVFSYSAVVKPSPAYQGDVALSPQPIFRSVADVVDVQYSYDGGAGEVAVTAELAASSGWTWSVPLQGPTAIAVGSSTGQVSLELDALDDLAAAGAKASGIPTGVLTVSVVPTITTASGQYAPALPMLLGPSTLTLEDGPESLVDSGTTGDPNPGASNTVAPAVENSIGIFGFTLAVTSGRLLAVFFVAVGLLGMLLLYRIAPRPDRGREADEIRGRFRDLILEVDPMPTPVGIVVDVPAIDDLARLAKQYSLLILNGINDEGEVFIIQDEFLAYRYRPAEPVPATGSTRQSGTPNPEDPLSIL
jgi:hypothetical protein